MNKKAAAARRIANRGPAGVPFQPKPKAETKTTEQERTRGQEFNSNANQKQLQSTDALT